MKKIVDYNFNRQEQNIEICDSQCPYVMPEFIGHLNKIPGQAGNDGKVTKRERKEERTEDA